MFLTLMPTGCLTGTSTRGIEEQVDLTIVEVCKTFPNLTWSSKDTPETILEIKRFNAAQDKLCGDL